MHGDQITNRIKAIVTELGIPMADFYRDCGISSGAFSQWKTGKTNPSIQTLTRIANYLGVTVSELMDSPSEERRLRIRPLPPAEPPKPGLRIRGNKKSPVPNEDEADKSELIRILSVLDSPAIAELLAHAHTLEALHEARGNDPKSP